MVLHDPIGHKVSCFSPVKLDSSNDGAFRSSSVIGSFICTEELLSARFSPGYFENTYLGS